MSKEKTTQPDPLEDAETIAKCRGLYKRIEEIEKEQEMHKDRAKDCGNRADALRSEIREIIMEPRNQLELLGKAGSAPAPTA